jgi:hypothetical protein
MEGVNMEQVGVMLTCDRCGHTQFLENNNTEAIYISDIVHSGPNRDIRESWGRVFEEYDICPTCSKQYFEMVNRFMDDKKPVTNMNLDKDTITKVYRSVENCLRKSDKSLLR